MKPILLLGAVFLCINVFAQDTASTFLTTNEKGKVNFIGCTSPILNRPQFVTKVVMTVDDTGKISSISDFMAAFMDLQWKPVDGQNALNERLTNGPKIASYGLSVEDFSRSVRPQLLINKNYKQIKCSDIIKSITKTLLPVAIHNFQVQLSCEEKLKKIQSEQITLRQKVILAHNDQNIFYELFSSKAIPENDVNVASTEITDISNIDVKKLSADAIREANKNGQKVSGCPDDSSLHGVFEDYFRSRLKKNSTEDVAQHSSNRSPGKDVKASGNKTVKTPSAKNQ